MKTVGITVRGKVQGVFFRKHTVEAATRFGITGFVQNSANGDVYIEATGNEKNIIEFTAWCRSGSPRSDVEQVLVEQLAFKSFEGFVIRYSF